jgi:WbqC-like protein family
MKVVISQPMYFPWIGLFEQVKLCDIYVHYDDVQFSKGSFTNRVQIKTSSPKGFSWITVPLKGISLEARINELQVDNQKNWQNQHLDILNQTYKAAPYKKDMIEIVKNLFDCKTNLISEISKKSMELIIDYYNFANNKSFYVSSRLNIEGKSSERVYRIVRHFDGTRYITGHGAKQYLNHQHFDENGIKVEYMNYLRLPYNQLYGEFNPHVSTLDLIANIGKKGEEYFKSTTKYWKEFLA